ncbi:MAG: hypothetical protein H6672_13420 [Anaerolineaceae bacterium]|nr:hypothetical protein [Anaerolineaceae bacterium]
MKGKAMLKDTTTPPTILTLTLPTPEDGGIAPERATATLLIQRGDLAHIQQFHYSGDLPDVMDAIRAAMTALGALEDDPPVIPDLPADPPKPAPKAKGKPAASSPPDEEPTIDIPLNKGTLAVKISHLKIVGGESDAAAYRQAALIAGKLVDGKLWDGQTPIRLRDVYALAKRMQHLADRELSLFTLDDFAETGAADAPETVSDTSPSPNGATFSSNGHHAA